jgi:hypothetical protein
MKNSVPLSRQPRSSDPSQTSVGFPVDPPVESFLS